MHEREAVRAGTVTEPVLQGALRVAGALPGLTDLWPKAPRQALARLHVLAARDLVPEAELGRPVADPVVAARLDGLAGLVAGGTTVPPLVLAAVVHGELLNLRPFAGPSGVVARAAARLVLLPGASTRAAWSPSTSATGSGNRSTSARPGPSPPAPRTGCAPGCGTT